MLHLGVSIGGLSDLTLGSLLASKVPELTTLPLITGCEEAQAVDTTTLARVEDSNDGGSAKSITGACASVECAEETTPVVSDRLVDPELSVLLSVKSHRLKLEVD